jgi:transcription antitermination factor NusG
MDSKRKKKRSKKSKGQKEVAVKDFLKLNYRFKNNNEKWMTILLTENCNLLESHKIIENELEEVFGSEVVYFIPLYLGKIGKKEIGVSLFEGYIFIKQIEGIKECNFKKTDHLDKILYSGSSQRYVTNRDINRFKTKLKAEINNKIPKKGDYVIPKEGVFKNLEGKVLSVSERNKTALVEFTKKTRVVRTRLTVINFDVTR